MIENASLSRREPQDSAENFEIVLLPLQAQPEKPTRIRRRSESGDNDGQSIENWSDTSHTPRRVSPAREGNYQ